MSQQSPPGSTTASKEKSCTLCGVDCNGRARVKDPSGRYFCRPCYDTRAGVARSPYEQANSLGSPLPADDFMSLEPMPPTVVAPGVGSVPWPGGPARPKEKKARKNSTRPGVAITDFLFKSPFAPLAQVLAFVFAAALILADGISRGRATAVRRNPDLGGLWGDAILFGSISGLIGALTYWLVAPRFFRARLSWAGGEEIEPMTGRVVYMFSAAPAAIWVAIATLLMVQSGETPAQSMASIRPWEPGVGVGALILLSAGCAVTFLTAWQSFGASVGKAAFWFLALPISWYGLLLASTIIISTSGILEDAKRLAEQSGSPRGRVVAAPPDLSATKQFTPTELSPYDFRFPGNWTISEQVVPEETHRMLLVEAPDGSAFAMLVVEPHDPYVDSEMVLDQMVEEMPPNSMRGSPELIAKLGRFNGEGRIYKAVLEAQPARAVMFLRPIANARRLVVVMLRPEPDKQGTEAGFDLILNSLRVAAK